jgi:hypothetical protein
MLSRFSYYVTTFGLIIFYPLPMPGLFHDALLQKHRSFPLRLLRPGHVHWQVVHWGRYQMQIGILAVGYTKLVDCFAFS